jgi:hypothetical protein
MAKIFEFKKPEPDPFWEALLALQKSMNTALDRLAKIHIEELKKIGNNDILRKKFELQYPYMTNYIKKKNR